MILRRKVRPVMPEHLRRDKRADVMIGIPSYGMWDAEFGMCLLGLVMDFLGGPVKGFEGQSLFVWKREGTILPALRHALVRKAQERECTHLLFLDSDQTFPPYALRRLLEWHKPVVACNVATKAEESYPTARQKSGRDPKGRVVYTFPDYAGLEQVWRVGTGVMLVDMDVFAQVEPPWFNLKFRGGVDDYQGEDWTFCEKLEMHGIPIYVDHGLSWEVGHRGPRTYKLLDVRLPEISDKAWEKLKELKDAKGLSEVREIWRACENN
ncbi:MAG: hypothetical protein JRI39_00540 [Deltaproteobacteria bacterium]|nr:hypothetical protein [Deltaproteobacteria bacterium]